MGRVVSADDNHPVCVHFDDKPHEWDAVEDSREWADLIDRVLTPPPPDSAWWVRGHRVLSVGEIGDPRESRVTLIVAVSSAGAAAYFREMTGNVITGWITCNDDPMPHAPELPFSAQGGTAFPPNAVVQTEDLRNAVAEFMKTGTRPRSLTWQQSPWLR